MGLALRYFYGSFAASPCEFGRACAGHGETPGFGGDGGHIAEYLEIQYGNGKSIRIIYVYNIYILYAPYMYIYIHINYSIINLVIDDFPTKASIYRGISMDVMGFLIAMGLGQARMAHATEEF